MSNELWHCTMEEKAAMDANLLRVERERDDMTKAYRTAAKVIEESLPGIAAHASEAVDKQKAAEARVAELELVLAATANNYSGSLAAPTRTAGLCWCGVSWNTEFVPDEHSKSCLIARAALDPIPKEAT